MLAELTLKAFIDKVISNDPVPGGGSVSALNGALAASLAAIKLPKETDEEKATRSEAIQRETKYAAEVPMEVARAVHDILPQIATVAQRGNSNAVTDACVAMMCARTAVLGALLNVKINLSSIKDEAYVKAMSEEAARLEIDTMEQERNLLLYAKEQHGL